MAIYNGGLSIKQYTAGTGIDIDSNNAIHNSNRWNAVTRGATWSRICLLSPTVTVEGLSGILSVSCTRGNVVCNATFTITSSHYNTCNIIQISSNSYTSFKIRGIVNTDGYAYIELYDDAVNISTSTNQTWRCSWIPLLNSTLTPYTSFTSGTSIPSGYVESSVLTVSVGRSIVADNFVGNLTGNASSSSAIAVNSQILTSATAVDNFLEANKLKCAIFSSYSDIGFASNDGMIISVPWKDTTSYGAQIAFDDTTGGVVKIRTKNSSWSPWKKVWVSGDAVTGAVWNDLIDCIEVPEGDSLEPGYCYGMCEDGHYRKTDKYLDNKFIGIDSDTYSLAMGMEPEKRKLNAAVSGFVLAYVDKEYPIGTALTCTKDGFLTEMKREDKCYNPELIIATYWKNEEKEEIVKEDKTVKVNGRKWVKIK